MARLGGRRSENAWAWWSASLWRGAAACMAITVACGVWFYTAPKPPPPPTSTVDLSQELQSAVFAPMGQPNEDEW